MLVIGVFASIIALGIARGWIGYEGCDLNILGGLFVSLWIFGLFAQCLRAKLVSDILKMSAVFWLLAIVASQASAVLSLTRFPLQDQSLVRMDGWLIPGYSWWGMVGALARYPTLMKTLSFGYGSLDRQPFLLIVLLCISGQAEFGWRFLTCWALALLLSIGLFPLVPALGGYAQFGISRAMVQTAISGAAWHGPDVLMHLRDGTITTLNVRTLEGIVTMPSFHAASAVLLGWGYGRIPFARWPFLALNVIMWFSAVPIGGHYIVDVIAGTTIGLGVIVMGTRYGGMDTRPATSLMPARGRPPRNAVPVEQ